MYLMVTVIMTKHNKVHACHLQVCPWHSSCFLLSIKVNLHFLQSKTAAVFLNWLWKLTWPFTPICTPHFFTLVSWRFHIKTLCNFDLAFTNTFGLNSFVKMKLHRNHILLHHILHSSAVIWQKFNNQRALHCFVLKLSSPQSQVIFLSLVHQGNNIGLHLAKL